MVNRELDMRRQRAGEARRHRRVSGRRGEGAAVPIWRFFAISHGFSWGFWIAAALLAGGSIWESPARWLVYVGGLGPLIAGVAMTYGVGGRAGLRDLAARIVDPRRIPARWLAVALLLPVISMGLAVGAAALAGDLATAVDAGQLRELLPRPVALLGFAAFVLVFGPIPEEIGWRGYALDAMQARWSALTASLLLGVAWALWHGPLFFIGGYYGATGPPDPLHFTLALLVHSVLYTWIYNHTGRSVLVAILFHFMINFVGMLVEGVPRVEWTRTGFAAVVAMAVVVYWGRGGPRRVTAPAPANPTGRK
jgi:uncharacterized protein